MSFPVKIDGIGTRLKSDGTFNEPNVGGHRSKFVRLFAAEAIAKGDAVAIDVGSDANGLGNHIKIADGNVNAISFGIGVAAEATPTGHDFSTMDDPAILVQVAGFCDFAKVIESTCEPGQGLSVSDTPGIMDIRAGATDSVLALQLKDATPSSDSAATSTVYLCNPLNL